MRPRYRFGEKSGVVAGGQIQFATFIIVTQFAFERLSRLAYKGHIFFVVFLVIDFTFRPGDDYTSLFHLSIITVPGKYQCQAIST